MSSNGEESDFDEHYIPEVSDTREDTDDTKLSADALGNLFNSSAPARPKINIKKEDLQLVMKELELPEGTVRAKLIETNGDVRATLRSLCGL
ncbi:hypothetical protein B9Z55_001788 [Caenorhabditis nigoni]|uniref:Nascent polypeptide-associated complex subunit alpha-like UBA domain-containing protein n=1 Tax=Caenorhabditis nigoni TaxID=1611254 RepID=A0A2G5VHV1_9PELO|nr:hypothetical protein B9Z55_001788 [Caenorhabditis nigoni]